MIAHDPHAEDLHLIVIGHKNLEETRGFAHRDRTIDVAVVHHGDPVGNFFLAGLCLIESHSGDFGIKEHDGRDVLVNQFVRGVAKDALDGVAAFQFADVDQ